MPVTLSRRGRLGRAACRFVPLAAIAITIWAGAHPAAARAATPAPSSLTVGQLSAPVDVENLSAPLLGWHVGGGTQGAYQVQVASSASALTSTPDVWDSGEVASAENSNVAYAGPALTRSSGYYWRVRTWDASGDAF